MWRFADQGVGGDAYPAETPEAVVERQHVNDSYGQDSQFDDHPLAEYKFFFANGVLDVSGAHDLDGLRERNNVAPEHDGPTAVGNLIVQDGTAIWEVVSNVSLGALVKALKKYTKDAGWDWGGVTDMKGEPLGDPEKLATMHFAVHGGLSKQPKIVMSSTPREWADGCVYIVNGRVAAVRSWAATTGVVNNLTIDEQRECLQEWADDFGYKLAEYPGGGVMTDQLRNHAPLGEDLELKNIDAENPETRELERFHKDKDRTPEGIFKCPTCGILIHRWHEYLVHRREEEPPGDSIEDGHFPTVEESLSQPLDPIEAATERLTPLEIESKFLHGARRLAIKQPKDMFTEPVPFIYDIELDRIFVGHPGARHGEIEAPPGTKFTPGGIIEGEYQPGGKVVVESQSDTPYSIRHMIGLWYWQHPEFEVTGIMMTMPDGKQRKIAKVSTQNIGAYVIGQAAQDPAVHAAWTALQKVGGEVYGVGGVVRDALLGKPSKDVDLLVTGLPAERVDKTLRKLPGRVDLTGKDFGVFRYNHDGHEVEIALPRTERSTGERRVDFDVAVDHTLPVETDLQRRDFTANAIAVNLRTGEMVDPYGGADDIANKRLRTVHDNSFPEDPTRLVRGLVAHSRHDLHPDPKTLRQMQVHAPDLAKESPERIQAELDKLFSSDNPGAAIRMAHKTGMLKYLLPEVEAAWDFVQNNPHHQLEGGKLGEHLVAVLDYISTKTEDPDLRLAALLHDIGKPGSEWVDPETGTSHYYRGPEGQGANHEELGAEQTEGRLRELKGYAVPRIKRMVHLVKHHMYPDFSSPKGARKFLNRVGPEHAHDLMLLREADRSGKGTDEYQNTKTPVDVQRRLVDEALEAKAPTDRSALAINGNDLMGLGLQPGPAFSQMLQALTELVLDHPEYNDKHTLLNYVRHELMPSV